MKSIKPTPAKIVTSILVLSYLAALGIVLRRNFSQIRSTQAFVNGEIIVVRAAIAGELALNSEKIKLSHSLEKGTQIGTIQSTVENPRVSILKVDKQQLATRLQDFQQQLSGVNQQIQNRTKLINLFTHCSRNR